MLWWLAQNAVVAAALAGVVALLCRRFQFRPAIRHALWLVVLVKLMTPSFIQWPWPTPAIWPHVLGWGEPSPDRAVTVTEPPSEESESRAVVLTAHIRFLESVKNGADVELLPAPTEMAASTSAEERTGAAIIAPAAPAPVFWPSWLEAGLLGAWLSGAALLACGQAIGIVRFARRVRASQAVPEGLQAHLREAANRLGVRAPRLRVLPGVGSPQVWSLGSPVLLWPAALLDLPAERVRAILLHELAHLRRRDHWVSWLLLVAAWVWWWNPLFWYVRRQVRLNAELACDAWVVWLLPAWRRAYAEALIEVTEFVSLQAAPQPALGMSSGQQDFERRLTMIMRERVPCQVPAVALLGIGLLALLALPGWLFGQKDDKKAPPTDSVKEIKDSDDVKLQDLERKLQKMLEEIKAMRAKDEATKTDKKTPPPSDTKTDKKTPPPPYTTKDHKSPTTPVPPTPPTETKEKKKAELDEAIEHKLAVEKGLTWLKTIRVDGGKTVALSRTTYKMPKDKAEALGAFLKEHVKADVMELKLEGDTLTVTTTPEAQQTIGGLIALMQGHTTKTGDDKVKPK